MGKFLYLPQLTKHMSSQEQKWDIGEFLYLPQLAKHMGSRQGWDAGAEFLLWGKI